MAKSETGTFSGTYDSWCKSVVGRFVRQARLLAAVLVAFFDRVAELIGAMFPIRVV